MKKTQSIRFIPLLVALLLVTSALAASSANWSTPENLSDWQVTLNEPWLLRGADGTQVIFWIELDLGSNQEALWARVRPPGGNWSSAANIFGWIDYSVAPETVITPDGTVWVLWMMPDKGQIGDNMQVKVAGWAGSGPWGMETLSNYESAIRNIDLSVGPDGHLAATWVACASLTPPGNGPCAVNIRRRPPGIGLWDFIERLDAPTGTGILYGRSLVGPGGMIVTTWGQVDQFTANEWHIMGRAFDPGSTTWEPSPPDISQGGFTSNLWPFLAEPVMGADGTVIAAWYKQDPADYNKADLYSATRQALTGTWSSPVAISNVHDATKLWLPKIAVGQNGTAVIAWEQKDGLGGTAVFANVRDPGFTWGGPAQVSAYLYSVDLTAPLVWADGSSMLLWEASDNSRDSKEDETLFWSGRPNGGAWGGSGQGQLGEWYDSVDGANLAYAHDGSVSVLWGVRDGYQPVDQRAKALAASWIPPGAPSAVDTLQGDYNFVDVSDESVVMSANGQIRAAAWLTSKSVTSPTDPREAVYYAEVVLNGGTANKYLYLPLMIK